MEASSSSAATVGAPANGSAAAAPAVPSPTQLLFARAVILTMELWPAMRMAVAEQWGGVESLDKRDFLISHICDTYSTETAVPTPAGARGALASSAAPTVAPPTTPDVDDLADTLQMYFDDEFESRIEDKSPEWVALRIVHLHKLIYAEFPPTQASLQAAEAEVQKLYQATVQLRGQKVSVQRTHEAAEGETHAHSDDSSSDDDDDDEEGGDVEMQLDAEPQPTRRERQEPVVDDEGFTMVVKGKRRA